MAVDEHARRLVFDQLEAAIGGEAARLLMEQLPPVAWQDLATKQDLAQLENRLVDEMDRRFLIQDARLDRIEARLAGIDGRFAGIEGRFVAIDGRFAGIDERFVAIDERFKGIEERFKGIDHRFAEVKALIGESKNEVLAVVRKEMVTAIAQQTRTMVLGMATTLISVVLSVTALATFIA